MKIIFIKISELKPAEYNPRQASKKEIEDIRRSLEMFGFIDPNIVNMHPDREKVIVGGHLRTQVWGEMGNDLVPCVTVSLPLEKEKELNVRLNKNSGSWDWDKLANEFEIEDLLDWGFSEKDLDFDNDPEAGERLVSPEYFQEFDNNLKTDFKCPKCNYEWSGQPN